MLSVVDVMTSEVFAVAPDTYIETAARLLTRKRITGAPVVDDDGRPIGVVSVGDLLDPDGARGGDSGYPMFYRIASRVAHAVGDSAPAGEGRVEDVMSPFVLAIEPGASLLSAANRMVSEGVHRLLVMDQGRLVGIVSSLDVLRGLGQTTETGVGVVRARLAGV